MHPAILVAVHSLIVVGTAPLSSPTIVLRFHSWRCWHRSMLRHPIPIGLLGKSKTVLSRLLLGRGYEWGMSSITPYVVKASIFDTGECCSWVGPIYWLRCRWKKMGKYYNEGSTTTASQEKWSIHHHHHYQYHHRYASTHVCLQRSTCLPLP